MICNKCGFNNEDDIKYCENCGERLEATEQSPAEQVAEETGAIEVTSEAIEATSEATEAPEAPETPDLTDAIEEPFVIDTPVAKKKSKLPLLLTLIVIGVLGIAGISYAALGGFGEKKSDEEKLVDAVEKTMKAQQMVMEGEMYFDNFELSGDAVDADFLVGTLVESFVLQYKCAMDKEAKMFEGTISVNMGRASFITMNIQINEDFMALEIPELYDEMVYMKWDDLGDYLMEMGVVTEEDLAQAEELMGKDVMAMFDLYMEALNIENMETYKEMDIEGYDQIIYDALADQIEEVAKGELSFETMDEDIVIEGDVYTFDFDYEKMMDSMMLLVEKILEDENIEPLLYEMVDKFFDTAIEQEDIMIYNLMAASEAREPADAFDDDVKDYYNEMRDMLKDGIEEGYEEAIDEVEEAMDDSEFDDMMDMMLEAYKSIDMSYEVIVRDGYLSGAKMEYSVDDSIIDAFEEMAGDMADETNMDEAYSIDVDDIMSGTQFDITIVNNVSFTNLDEPIEFTGIKDGALNIAELDQMGLFEILNEIQENLGVMGAMLDY